jgi:hypothetical protein
MLTIVALVVIFVIVVFGVGWIVWSTGFGTWSGQPSSRKERSS